MADITFKNVCKTYDKKKTVVENFTLEIKDKEFVVFVGPSGCGKSTTIRMLAGLEEISDGEIYVGDRLINNMQPKDRNVAMVFQNYALYPHMSVRNNIAFGLKLKKIPKPEIEKKINEAAKILDIMQYLDCKPSDLSGGQRQRVALGRAMVRDADVFLLDEPLSNLDAKLRNHMRAEISKLHEVLGKTFIYVTHDQTEAMTMGDRIVVMKGGKIMQVARPQDLYDRPNSVFVAGFIGTPQMNFLNAKILKSNDQYMVKIGNLLITLPNKSSEQNLRDYIDREVIIGIRPENIHIEDVFVKLSKNSSFKTKIDLTELIGAEINLHFELENARLIAKVPSRNTINKGDIVELSIDPNKIHIFDKNTEMAIYH